MYVCLQKSREGGKEREGKREREKKEREDGRGKDTVQGNKEEKKIMPSVVQRS